jgi:hypothetical protein
MTVLLPQSADSSAPGRREAGAEALEFLDPVVIVLIDALARADAYDDHRAQETVKSHNAPRRDLR